MKLLKWIPLFWSLLIYGQEEKDNEVIKIRSMNDGKEKLFKFKKFISEFSKL